MTRRALRKPPLGARPHWLWLEHMRTARIGELSRAIGRYEASGLVVPCDWLTELESLLSADHHRAVEALPALSHGREVQGEARA